MPQLSAPFLFTQSLETAKYSNPTFTKILVSSLSRNLFTGFIHVFRNHERPLFKVERRQIEEVFVSAAWREETSPDARNESRAFLFELGKQVKPEQRKFLQALYFGTYFGDETGVMPNIPDA